MDYGALEIQYGFPLRGHARDRLCRFLERHGLDYEGGVDFTVNLLEDDEIVATASLAGNIVRYVAVSWTHQSRGLAATVVSEVVNHAAALGRDPLFVFTHPRNRRVFSSLGFHPVAGTDKALLLESRKGGVERYVGSLRRPAGDGIGCVVAECNPFTNGHLHLVEEAARQSSWLHLFILPDSFGDLPTEVRRSMATEATRHLGNVVVQPTSPYLMPPYAFPDYFIEEKERSEAINCSLDLTLFAQRIAVPLGIVRRYVEREPGYTAAAGYNREMARILPAHGIEVVELPRITQGGRPVSAGLVRRLFRERKFAEARELVPPATYSAMETQLKLNNE